MRSVGAKPNAKAIDEGLGSSGKDSVQTALSEVRAVGTNELKDIRTVLRGHVQTARFERSKRADRIVMALQLPVIVTLPKAIGICSENTKGGLVPPEGILRW